MHRGSGCGRLGRMRRGRGAACMIAFAMLSRSRGVLLVVFSGGSRVALDIGSYVRIFLDATRVDGVLSQRSATSLIHVFPYADCLKAVSRLRILLCISYPLFEGTGGLFII